MCMPSNWLYSEEPMASAISDFSNRRWGGRSINSPMARPTSRRLRLPTRSASRNHPFVDGNKRAAFASMIVFLGLNGIDFDVPPEAATAIIVGLAAGEIHEDGLARWIRDS